MIEGMAFDLANDIPLEPALLDIIAADNTARRYGITPSQARFLAPYDRAAQIAADEYERLRNEFR